MKGNGSVKCFGGFGERAKIKKKRKTKKKRLIVEF